MKKIAAGLLILLAACGSVGEKEMTELKKTSMDISGVWSGVLKVSGTSLAIIFHFEFMVQIFMHTYQLFLNKRSLLLRSLILNLI